MSDGWRRLQNCPSILVAQKLTFHFHLIVLVGQEAEQFLVLAKSGGLGDGLRQLAAQGFGDQKDANTASETNLAVKGPILEKSCNTFHRK
jgi:hypothetical protein